MTDNTRVNIFMEYLDRILSREKDVEYTGDIEIDKLLLLAKKMIKNDLSVNCNLNEKLKRKLLAQVNKQFNLSGSVKNDCELDEEDLELVAAGSVDQTDNQKDICPYCGCSLKTPGGKCSVCGH